MSVIITKKPSQLVTALNDIVINAYESDISSSSGSFADGLMDITDFHLEEDYFRIQVIYGDITWNKFFFCKTTITDNTRDYPVQTTETLIEWAYKLIDTILRNPVIINNFKIRISIITTSRVRIRFTPYNPPDSIAFAKSNISVPFSTQDSSYTAPVYHDNLLMALQLFVIEYPNSVTELLYKNPEDPLFKPVTINYNKAEASWNLKDVVRNEYNGHFTFPLDGERHYHYIVDSYKANIYSIWGSPPIAQNNTLSDEFYVLDAKFSKTKIREMNTDGETITDILNTSKQFLTNAPIIKITDIYAPEKLNWLFQSAYTNAKLRIKEYYTNGTNQIRDITTFSVTAWCIIEFEVGFQTIKCDDYQSSGLIPEKWDVWLEDSGQNFISEIRTFVIDTNYQQYARYFIFKNRWGVYESFRTIGQVKKINEIKKTLFEQEIEEPDFTDRDISQIDEQSRFIINFNTGWMAKNWQQYLSDEFMVSRDVYWLKGDAKYAVLVDQGSVVFEEDGIYNSSFKFKSIISDVSDSMYSVFDPAPELPVLGDFNGDFNDDYLI